MRRLGDRPCRAARRAANRAARAALCVVLIASWSGGFTTFAQTAAAQAAPRAAAKVDPADPAALAAELRTRVRRLVAASRELSPDPLDASALVAAAGRDPAALTRWVREQIRYEPYHGFMKGSAGAVVSRRANAADKALLLAEALQSAGVKAQLVRGKIDPKLQPGTELPPPETTPDPDAAALESFAAAAGLPAARLRALLDEGRAAREAAAEKLWTRFQRDFDLVAAQLQQANVPTPPAAQFTPPDEHWWVRTDAGDLDPTFDTKPAAQELGVFDLKKLPPDALHTLTVRIKISRDDGTQSVLLDAPLRAPDLFGRTIVVGNMPLDTMDKLEKLGQGAKPPTPEQVVAALASATKFQPQVSTPNGPVAGAPFDLAGNVLPMSGGRLQGVADVGGAARGGFGGGFGGALGGGGDEKKQATKLNGCWVEFVLAGPGSNAPVTVRRDLLTEARAAAEAAAPKDKDAAAQKVLDLLAVREVLVLPEELSSAFVTDATLDFTAQWADHLASIMGGLAQRPVSLKNYAGAPRLNPALFGFANGRRVALRRLRDGRFKDTTYVHARPTVVSHTLRFVAGKQAKSVAGLDILHNDLVALGPKAPDWQGSFALALGVLDTALEHVANAAGDQHSNTSVLLDRALLEGRQPAVAATPDALGALKVSEAARKQMRDGGDRLAHVVVPGETSAWYAVNLDTGASLGYVEGGGGQDTSEYVVVTDIIIQLKEVFEFYADLFKCIGIGITAPLSGSLDARRDFLDCAWNLICKKIPDLIASMVGFEMDSWTNIIVHQTLQKTIWEGFCQKMFDNLAGPKK